ncbi:hypothetical protein PCE1_002518 [Barthelona sp. PCE]
MVDFTGMTLEQLENFDRTTLDTKERKKLKRKLGKIRKKAQAQGSAHTANSTNPLEGNSFIKQPVAPKFFSEKPEQLEGAVQPLFIGTDNPRPIIEHSDQYITPIEGEYNLDMNWAGPETPVVMQYPNGFPTGEWQPYAGSKNTNMAEALESERVMNSSEYAISCLRRGAAVHRQTRRWIQSFIKPGMDISSCVDHVDRTNRKLIGYDPLNPTACGLAFPCGMSVNECAAHYQPMPGETRIFNKSDVVKVDFGTHVDGFVIDSAFTVAWDDEYLALLDCARDATNTGIATAGADVRLCDVGEAIEEVMLSYTVAGKQVQPVRNLTGHMVGKYRVHAGKSIPLYNNNDTTKMLEGETYALETFASTGLGVVDHDGPSSHFMINFAKFNEPINNRKERDLMAVLKNQFSSLAWCHRWLKQIGTTKYMPTLRNLIRNNFVNDYPPLTDFGKENGKACHVAQFEHTFIIGDTGKEVFTRCDDY